MLRGWLLVLTAFLLIWMPMTLAGELSATLPSLSMRGPAAVLELLLHAAITAVTVAAGWALAHRNPHAPRFAAIAIVASCAVTVQSIYWSVLPGRLMPGDKTPLAIAAIVHAALWIAYLRRSRRVRAIYG